MRTLGLTCRATKDRVTTRRVGQRVRRILVRRDRESLLSNEPAHWSADAHIRDFKHHADVGIRAPIFNVLPEPARMFK
ncbi:MAG: hypothetical protein ABI651_14860 [Verrucomicrobiota bacterium]